MLDKEFKYYITHQDDLVKSHYGRFIIIKGEKVLGDFGGEVEAILHGKNELHLKMGTFLVQQCLPGKENYTNFISSALMITL